MNKQRKPLLGFSLKLVTGICLLLLLTVGVNLSVAPKMQSASLADPSTVSQSITGQMKNNMPFDMSQCPEGSVSLDRVAELRSIIISKKRTAMTARNDSKCQLTASFKSARGVSHILNGMADHYWGHFFTVNKPQHVTDPRQVGMNISTNWPVQKTLKVYKKHNERCQPKTDSQERRIYYAYSYYSEHFEKESSRLKRCNAQITYLPIFWRMDFIPWDAHAARNSVAATDRKYLINAVFALSTSRERSSNRKLFESLASAEMPFDSFVKLLPKWAGSNSGDGKGYLNGEQFADVLNQSVFTMAPAGHSPETFRLWEAIGMGSIPLMATADRFGSSGSSCVDPLFPIVGRDGISRGHFFRQRGGGIDHVQFEQWYENVTDVPLKEFIPLVLLHDWEEELIAFLNVAHGKDWSVFQRKVIQWWEHFVEERMTAVLDSLLTIAPWCL